MEKNENEINVLDELNKGACMGRDAIHFILDKVHSDELKETLHKMDPDIEASIDYSINKKEAIVKYEDIADFIK